MSSTYYEGQKRKNNSSDVKRLLSILVRFKNALRCQAYRDRTCYVLYFMFFNLCFTSTTARRWRSSAASPVSHGAKPIGGMPHWRNDCSIQLWSIWSNALSTSTDAIAGGSPHSELLCSSSLKKFNRLEGWQPHANPRHRVLRGASISLSL